MQPAEHTLSKLCQNIRERGQWTPITFTEFLEFSADNPELVLRDIFRIFYDMIYAHVGDGMDEYPDDPESINYVYYDCSSLFVDGTDHPFFADRLFANRLINHISSFRRGVPQNSIYIFEGPHGCGKSTFLNNLLMKFEQYTRTEEGSSYETVWRIDKEKLGVLLEHEAHALLVQLRSLVDDSSLAAREKTRDNLFGQSNKEYLEVSCPSHDNPLLLIPKAYRKDMILFKASSQNMVRF